jgi:hypothetical protein
MCLFEQCENKAQREEERELCNDKMFDFVKAIFERHCGFCPQ